MNLAVWLCFVAVAGLVLNYRLNIAFRNRNTARSLRSALAVGLVFHIGVSLAIGKLMFPALGLANQAELVGYFVFPFILMFITTPLVLFTYYRPAIRIQKSE